MSLADLQPSDVPVELRVKIEHVMQQERMTWNEAVIFLARKVVPPSKAIGHRSSSFCP